MPTPPDGYKAIGHVVTNSPDKPSLDKIRCVRSDLTDQCEAHTWTWGAGNTSDANGFNVYSLRPSNRGIHAIWEFQWVLLCIGNDCKNIYLQKVSYMTIPKYVTSLLLENVIFEIDSTRS